MTLTIPKHPCMIRFSGSANDTISLFFFDGKFQHYVIEDEYREVKLLGETRIPAGIYGLELRTEGGHHIRYARKFPQIHEGMVHLLDVPNFKWILYHIGNTDDDTEGCLCPGDIANNNQVSSGMVQQSTAAYVRTYPKLRDYIKTTKKPIIEIIDADRP